MLKVTVSHIYGSSDTYYGKNHLGTQLLDITLFFSARRQLCLPCDAEEIM